MKFKRTHHCGALTGKDAGAEVILMGWVQRRRDHGGVIFVDLRDREGLTQVVFNPKVSKAVHKEADQLRSEYVIGVKGKVGHRPEGMKNPKMKTGEIEVSVTELEIFNASTVPPFMIEDETDAGEHIRFKYRYLDLRRKPLQENLKLRHRVAQITRKHLSDNGFLELETPFLIKTTPEGARDYLVPSRINPGHFYALPQSPQLYKQLFMMSGFDKYFQIVRCFRDEDIRADRQPEFTQIDIEMSFVDEEDVMSATESLVAEIFRHAKGKELETPFQRLSYEEAIRRYGVDKPDTRFGLELQDITDIAKSVEFQVFSYASTEGGLVKGINIPKSTLSRKDFDDLTTFVSIYGAKGLAWAKIEKGSWKSPIAKYFKPDQIESINKIFKASEGDALVFVADTDADVVNSALGNLRVYLGKKLKLIDESKDHLVWVDDFPLLEFDSETNRYVSKHHPFTAPKAEHMDLLEKDPGKVLSNAYDLVLNGSEIAGGSIRIHRADVQKKVFKALNIGPKEAQQKFGFLLDALQFGAPPHGGIAFGFDRLIALLCGESSIREVISFPKTQKALCLMTDSPSVAEAKQLKELHIKVTK